MAEPGRPRADVAVALNGEGRLRDAVELSVTALDHIDGMMRFGRKYCEVEFTSVECIDVVLRIAPLLLDCESLDRLEEVLKERRQIQKNTSEDLAKKLADARELMSNAYNLANYLERNGHANVVDSLRSSQFDHV